MSNLIDRSYPAGLETARGDTFLTNMNADRVTVYGHADDIEAQHELLATEYFGKGTIPTNAALLTIDAPVAGRVYCPADYLAIIGAAVQTTATISQEYLAGVVTYIFLSLDTDGTLSLRASAAAAETANDVLVATVDDTGVTAIDNDPTGKTYATLDADNIADDSIDSAHIAAGAIDLEHLSTGAKIVYDRGQYATGWILISDTVSDTETVTIGADVYEFDVSADGVTGGRIDVDCDGSKAAALAALIAAINASGTEAVTADTPADGDYINLTADAVGPAGNIVLSNAATNVTTQTMAGGRAAGDVAITTAKYTVTALDATRGKIQLTIEQGTDVLHIQCEVRSSAGLLKADTTVAEAGGVFTLTEGAAAWAANDVVTILTVCS